MCLNLNKNNEKQIASEDIICYKRLIHKPDFTQYVDKSFTGIIKDIDCEGKIQVENNDVYFCTNNLALNGCKCINKLGYEYSWKFDDTIQSIIVDEIDLMIPIKNTVLITPYQYAKVEIGKAYISELLLEYNNANDAVVYVGLHSFTTYEDARINRMGVIAKCIIPKGAEYYEGTFLGYKSFASTQLKYLEIVEK